MRFLLLGESSDLRNRTLHIRAEDNADLKVQNEPGKSEIKVQNGPINSLGLAELALVKAISANNSITLDQLANTLGKSRSTVKRIIESLKEKGILTREGARKNGKWILKD